MKNSLNDDQVINRIGIDPEYLHQIGEAKNLEEDVLQGGRTPIDRGLEDQIIGEKMFTTLVGIPEDESSSKKDKATTFVIPAQQSTESYASQSIPSHSSEANSNSRVSRRRHRVPRNPESAAAPPPSEDGQSEDSRSTRTALSNHIRHLLRCDKHGHPYESECQPLTID